MVTNRSKCFTKGFFGIAGRQPEITAARDEHDKGDRFERLVLHALRTAVAEHAHHDMADAVSEAETTFTFVNVAGGITADAEAGLETVLADFPDAKVHFDGWVIDGDTYAARFRLEGTHRGEFMGIPATGRHVSLQLVDIMRFDGDGRVSEHWGVADMLSLMQQLGAIPA